MTTFPWAIIAPRGHILFLEGIGKLPYEERGSLMYPKPEINPDPKYTRASIQATWEEYRNTGYQFFTGETIPFYSLRDEENNILYLYQQPLLYLGYTPLPFTTTQQLIANNAVCFAEEFTPPL